MRTPSLPAPAALPPAPLLTPLRVLRLLLGLALVALALVVTGGADSGRASVPPLAGSAPPGPPGGAGIPIHVDPAP